MRLPRPTPSQAAAADPALLAGAAIATILLPAWLFYARALADISISSIAVAFLLRSALTRDWEWRGRPFAVAAFAWWGWLVAASLLGGGLTLAVVSLRFPVFALALAEWVLRDQRAVRALRVSLTLAFAWLLLETWQQFLTGTNLFGAARWGDGALTGPFIKPRAGPELVLFGYAVLLPAIAFLARRAGRWGRVAAAMLAFLAIATLVLIGQRMPTLLSLLGLILLALLMPRARLPVLALCLAAVVLLALTPWISPPTHAKLVLHFRDQILHFPTTPYGYIYTRAANMAQQFPLLGWGFDGFRRGCGWPASMGAPSWLPFPTHYPNGGMQGCNIHPHNYYAEMAVDGGVPLLALFALMVASIWVPLGAALRPRPDPERLGLFISAVLALWPMASTSAATALPNAGWVFLVAGFGLARSPWRCHIDLELTRETT